MTKQEYAALNEFCIEVEALLDALETEPQLRIAYRTLKLKRASAALRDLCRNNAEGGAQ